MEYHRRSRDGCVNCRNARIKCDELRPSCRKCQARNVPCEGYIKALKWVVQPPQTDHGRSSSSTSTSDQPLLKLPGAGHRRTGERPPTRQNRSIRSLTRNPSRQLFSSDRELALFQHWWRVLPDVSFPNPRRHSRLLEENKAMILDYGHILVPMVVTCAAGHLVGTSGAATETEVLSLKQIAVQVMIRELGLNADSWPRQTRHLGLHHRAARSSPSSIDELSALLSASLHLIGIEIIQGSNMSSLMPLLRGAIFLVEKLSATSVATSSIGEAIHGLRYGTVVQMETKLLAYHDLMTCVPYPRRPLLSRKHWLEFEYPLLGGPRLHEPDMVMGFAADIILLTGECAALVEKLFRGTMAPEQFRLRRVRLLDQLEAAVKTLPAPVQFAEDPVEQDLEGSNQTRRQLKIHNPSVSAARSHARASQIFLMRTVDGSPLLIDDVAMNLEELVQSVPVDSPSVTIMLWPLWVLGCEADNSDQGLARRDLVRRLLRRMFAKEGFMNIRQCLNLLETQIWTKMDDHGRYRGYDSFATSSCPPLPPAKPGVQPGDLDTFSWVQACFHHHICPVLA